MSKVQDDEVGDGTTSVTVLAAELLRVNEGFFFFFFHVSHVLLLISNDRRFFGRRQSF